MSRAENTLVWVLEWLAALGLLGYGVYGIVSSRLANAAYQSSSDVREVRAVVTEVERRQYKDNDGDLNTDYRIRYEFQVDGTVYRGKDTRYRAISVGDVLSIEVYRTADGEYRESPARNPFRFLLYCGCTVVGAILTISLATSAVEKGRKQRAER